MKAPVGLLSDRTVLRQQDGGAPPRQVQRLRAQRSNESPSGAFKRQNGLAQQDGGASPRQVPRLRAQRSKESPCGAFKRQNGLAQQDGGASPRQVPRLRAQRSNESPSGAFKRQNGPASAGWRGPAPTSSAFASAAQQGKPLWGFQATERSCVSRMEGPRPDKFVYVFP